MSESNEHGGECYTPEPIDTGGVELNGSLQHLREVLSENVHDHYVLGRLAEGWVLGSERDDVKKTTPTLVPYSELSESEKDFDRTTAEQTLKAILKLGYQINDPAEQKFLDRYSGKARRVWNESGGGVHGVRQVLALRAEGFHWGSDPGLYCELTAAALAAGDLSLVYELANEGLEIVEEPRLVLSLARDRALAMAHEGRFEEAETELLAWLSRSERGSSERRDAASALGRISKERWYADADENHLRHAIDWYRKGFDEGDGDVFPAINVATLYAMSGQFEEAREWANRVMDAGDESAWGLASQGEALLVLGDAEGARERYRRYYEARCDSPRDIAASRKQAERLTRALGVDPSWLDDALPLPTVLVFAGVVPDSESNHEERRFPEDEEERVRQEIRQALERLRPMVVYCSAAAGSDILLLEEAAALKIETQVILPASAGEFRRYSVEPFGRRWVNRFDAVIAEAARTETLSRHFPPESEHALMFRYGNDVLLGSAMLRAQFGGFALGALVVWDGLPPRGPGGTGEFVAEWSSRAAARERWSAVQVIRASTTSPSQSIDYRHPYKSELRSDGQQEVRAMLFADVKNYSSLTEEILPQFQNLYMRQVSELLDLCQSAPLVVNTWGDAIYMVFDTVCSCGEFALAMSDRINAPDAAWRDSDLPDNLAIRTAVHAGPAFRLNDPVSRKFTYTGAHVTHAARLEPVTQPGQVYGTEAFASLAALTDVSSFSCHYVGQRKMAKNYGAAAVYRLVTTAPAGNG